jgi:hypothetical protein
LKRVGRLSFVAVLLLASHALADEPNYQVKTYDTADQIFKELLKSRPRVIAFGEYHETKEGAKVKSAIKRFTQDLLALVQKQSSDIVVETWIPAGKCGKKEAEVTKKVEETIDRPATTEDEVVTLIETADKAGVEPHILTLSCEQYQSIQPKDDGSIDAMHLLGVVTGELKKTILGIIAGKLLEKQPKRDKMVLVYGGALHNDVFPGKYLEEFSFAPQVTKMVKGKYLEVDLYVPEFIENEESVTAEAWYPIWQKQAQPGKPTLVRRSPRSYIIVFPKSS